MADKGPFDVALEEMTRKAAEALRNNTPVTLSPQEYGQIVGTLRGISEYGRQLWVKSEQLQEKLTRLEETSEENFKREMAFISDLCGILDLPFEQVTPDQILRMVEARTTLQENWAEKVHKEIVDECWNVPPEKRRKR